MQHSMIQQREGKHIRKGIIIILCLLLLAEPAISALASIAYGADTSQVFVDPNVVIRETTASDSINAAALLDTLRFDDGNPTYYVVYPNAAAAAADGLVAGATTTVAYQGNAYTARVFVGDHFDGAGGLQSIIADNTTLFFKPGNYITTPGSGYYLYFWKTNLSLIGLELNAGTPTVTFDLGYVVVNGWNGGNQNPRNMINDNFYAANIIFDGGGRDMKPKKTASDQAYYLHVMGDNVAFDNVTVRNIGTGSLSAGDQNVAINCINSLTAVFHDFTLQNINTKPGYGPIQVNNSSNNIYFDNLTLDNVSSLQGFVKMENGTTYKDGWPYMSLFFTGNLNFTNMTEAEKTIYVENSV